MVKCGSDWSKTFMGTIRREIDADGNPILYGSVIVEEGEIWSMASNEDTLGKNLDDICKMKLDMIIHDENGVSVEIAHNIFNLN